jgi:hypothetical protein
MILYPPSVVLPLDEKEATEEKLFMDPERPFA